MVLQLLNSSTIESDNVRLHSLHNGNQDKITIKLERKITTKYISLFNVKDQEEAAAAAEEGYGVSHPWGEVEFS